MLRTRYTVIVLLIIVAFDNIYCASVITKKDNIGNSTLRELEIRDSAIGNSRTKRGIEETIRAKSGASVPNTSPQEFISRNSENQSKVQLSIDASQGLSEKRTYLKKAPVNDKLYFHNVSSYFAENEYSVEDINEDNEDDFDLEGFDQVDFDQENDGKDEGEIYEGTELDIQPFSRHSSRGRAESGGGHGRHSSGGNGRHFSGGHDRHSSRGHGRHSGHRQLHLSNVTMPNGKRALISVPEQLKGWKCGKPTLLINLDPHGKNGRREFKLVAKVVQQTKREHSSGHFKHYRFIKIQKVVNGCFWKRYRMRQTEIAAEAKNYNERMLFHGTNKVKDLLKSGFDERYSNINGMFGAGIYFAKHSSKSNQYAFGLNQPCPVHKDNNCDKCARQIILCRVTMGKVKKETGAAKIAHAPPGYHSVEGVATHRPGGLQYPEYIVYRGEQVYPEYLITYRIVK